MNYLAHLYLSGEDKNLRLGNFIADGIKGNQLHSYHQAVQKGIRLHRAIDDFTDHHPIVAQSKKRLYPTMHKYAAVATDVIFDHFLAKNWNDYMPKIDLNTYSQAIYLEMNAQIALLPPKIQQLLPYMIKNNWLVAYGSLEGLDKVMKGMSQRAKFESNMDKTCELLILNYVEFEQEFKHFFDELMVFCVQYINQNPSTQNT